jgi:hypothetical protein
VFGRIVSLVACSAITLGAASAPVGVLTTVGSIRVDGADVRGNGTVLNGSVVETANNPSQMSLRNGIRFELSAQSRAQVFENRAVLERGASQIHASGGYPIQVNSLSVVPVGPSSTIRVFRASASKLHVSAVTGQAEVHNSSGLLIAKVFPGSSLDFDQQPAGAAGPTKVSGRLQKQDGRYIVTDVTTKTTVELQGENLENSVGHCIAATGSADPAAATLLHVATYDEVSCKKLGLPAAVGAGAATGGSAAGAGLSTPAIVAIVGGVAVAGSLGGAAAAGTFSGGNARAASGQ